MKRYKQLFDESFSRSCHVIMILGQTFPITNYTLAWIKGVVFVSETLRSTTESLTAGHGHHARKIYAANELGRQARWPIQARLWLEWVSSPATQNRLKFTSAELFLLRYSTRVPQVRAGTLGANLGAARLSIRAEPHPPRLSNVYDGRLPHLLSGVSRGILTAMRVNFTDWVLCKH